MKHTTQPETPLSRIPSCVTLAIILALTLVTFTSHSLADGTASYSFRQDNRDANFQPVVYEKTVGPVPEPLNATEVTPNSSYVFNVSGLQTSPTSLSSRASFTVGIDQEGIAESWSMSKANSVAEASLVDFATVQGAAGATSGTVIFNWVVTGAATLSLDTTPFNIIQVNDLSASAKLDSTIPDAMGSLLDETFSYPNTTSVGENWQQDFGIASDVVMAAVPWQAGVEMPVFFDLTSTVNLDVENLDAAGFIAGLDIDLSNTAVLQGVGILDDMGMQLSGASLVSNDGFVYPAVPEPSSLSLLMIALPLMQVVSRRRSKR